MASIKKIQERKFKITVGNGYRPDGRKISRAKTITVPDSVGKRGISQYVFHAAEEWERIVKNGFCEDAEMQIPGQAHSGNHSAEIPDGGFRCSQQRQAERDYPEEPGPDDRSADC